MLLSKLPSAHGFTLTELAIVLIIVGFLTGGLLMSLSTQQDMRNASDTSRQLNDATEALLGFAAANGRLPCPASNASNGQEAFCTNAANAMPPTNACGAIVTPSANPAVLTHGRCAAPLGGFLPAVSLGLRPVNNIGQLADNWGNPILYTVATSQYPVTNAYDFTTTDGIRQRGMSAVVPNIRACTDTACTTILVSNAAAVIFSGGKNGGGSGIDESANRDNDLDFVSHPPAPATAAAGEFDDILTWLSPNILYHRMISAGRLP